MPREIRVSPGAQQQIRVALDWWARHRPAAPDLLRVELLRRFELIADQPGIGAPALDDPIRTVRRIHLVRVRYHLYYREHDEFIEVLALWHTSRGQGPTLDEPA